jgi:hypothetical protein
MSNLIIHRDQAYTPEEWERRQKRLDADREYRQRPEVKERNREHFRRWRDAHREEYRTYKREWMRRKRGTVPPKPIRIGALHAVMCPGGIHPPRKSCRPIPMYDRPLT